MFAGGLIATLDIRGGCTRLPVCLAYAAKGCLQAGDNDPDDLPDGVPRALVVAAPPRGRARLAVGGELFAFVEDVHRFVDHHLDDAPYIPREGGGDVLDLGHEVLRILHTRRHRRGHVLLEKRTGLRMAL